MPEMAKPKVIFDRNNVESLLRKQHIFIDEFMSKFYIKQLRDSENDEEELLNNNSEKSEQVPQNDQKKTGRAKSLADLKQRLEVIKTKSSNLSVKDKLKKKSLKNRIRKKDKQIMRSAAKQGHNKLQKELKSEQATNEDSSKSEAKQPSKPIFNAGEKLVFSKFDFSDIGKKKQKKMESDPQKILNKLQKKKEKLKKLKESGDSQAVVEIQEKDAWKNALAKAEGLKVKDDELLLRKSIKNKEQKKRHSKNKWESRNEGVEKSKQERQKKRQENIDKKKDKKKLDKKKVAAKRGRIIPGL